jgi:hemoglobin
MTCLALVVCVLVSGPAAGPAAAQAQERTLYQRVGGYDVIAALVVDFFGRFETDAELTPFLGGLNEAAGARIHQHFVDFFCARTGGPCLYNGRDMKSTHAGLPIRDAHFEAVIRHISAALDAQKVAAREKQEILTMLRGLKSEIVQR